jgi:ketoreductase RED2
MPEERVAVVTGSSAGLGAAIARRLAGENFRLVINSARSADAGQRLAGELPEAIYVRADVSDEEQAQHLIAAAVDKFGRLDVLVNNAGTTQRIPHGDLTAATPDVWRQIMGLNVIGTWQTTVAAVPHLRERAGCVINMSSVAGSRIAGSSLPYAVSKAAVEHMTRLLAAAVGPEIRVNAVAPGLIETKWTAGWDDIRQRVEESTPLRRVGQPDDVADAVVGLIRSPYTTGAVLSVDGGAHLL